VTVVRTHYENLQIAENASPEVIKGAYRFLSQKWHPDKNPENRVEAERISRILNEAYAVLSDPIRRKEHDDWIRAQRQHTRPNQPQADAPCQPESAAVSAVPHPQGANFLKRTWLMLLFTASLVMVLGIFPYQLIWGEFKWGYVGGLFFWLAVGRYAYVQLFHPEIVAEENREKEARQKREAEPRKKATTFGWLAFGGAIPLSVITMMVQGAEFGVAALMSLFIAAAVGLLGWSLCGLYLRATSR